MHLSNVSSFNFNTRLSQSPFQFFFWPRLGLLKGRPRSRLRRSLSLGSLNKPRRRRQLRRHQTKGLMRKTIATHVRYKSLYISLSSSEKQEREMTKFCDVYETWRTTANFSYFQLELNAVVADLAKVDFLEPLAYQEDLNKREFRS